METRIEYILSLNWNKKTLEDAKVLLKSWDNRPKAFYQCFPKLVVKVDMAEREHLRNSINFWEKRLENETK